MDVQRTNRISFPKKKFQTKAALWAHVGALLQILDDTEHICVVWDDGETVSVDFNPADPALDYAQPYWLFADEYEQIEFDEDEDSGSAVIGDGGAL